MDYLLKIVIFHGYVKKTDGILEAFPIDADV